MLLLAGLFCVIVGGCEKRITVPSKQDEVLQMEKEMKRSK
jgi:hypothetical protein